MSKMIMHIYRISKQVGATKIILYSLQEAVNFYTACSFKEYRHDMCRDRITYGKLCPMYFNLLPDELV